MNDALFDLSQEIALVIGGTGTFGIATEPSVSTSALLLSTEAG